MMHIKMPVVALSLFAMFSCGFSKSVNIDLVTGLTTKGDGLSCDEVYLSVSDEKVNRNSFLYGEKFYLNFANIEGFEKEGSSVFPGLQLLIIGEAGDTIMHSDDLYANNNDGLSISPLLLQTNITVGKPMHSDNEYTLFVNIWDKKGEGRYSAEMDFDVVPNNQIKIEPNTISYDDIYLFSQEKNAIITDNSAGVNEDIYVIFEGLSGFQEEAGKVYIGLSINAKDAEGKSLLDEKDLMGEAGMDLLELKSQIAPNFVFSGTDIKNPITCEIAIWDKKSDHSIKASVDLNIQ